MSIASEKRKAHAARMERLARERPIIFSGDMIAAILAGKKTQTRRVVKTQPQLIDGLWHVYESESEMFEEYSRVIRCPYGSSGDRLWVRETWWQSIHDYAENTQINPIYFADDKPNESEGWVKKSPLFLPRSLSRITLEITNVRVERLLDLSNADALAEGIKPMPGNCGFQYIDGNEPTESPNCECCDGPVERFAALWDKINGKKHPWNANPHVWVLEFRRIDL